MLPDGTIDAHRIWKRFRPDRTTTLLRYEVDRMRSRFGRFELDWQWALRDVSLHAEPGSATGLVGNNGSGKSTLLKILTRVMYPYAGTVDVGGRVGALIEVRAGISPDLTGRENVNLYGTLLGLTRKQVASRFDEIVEFAQLEFAIDRQVKYYSTGMQMRLGFAVAAYLEPAVLLVDEVLAVGDAAFQQRCLERMRTVLDQGTTLVFVSHDLATVEAVCTDAMWLRNGVVAARGPVHDTLATYRRYIEETAELAPQTDGEIGVRKLTVAQADGQQPKTDESVEMVLLVESQRRLNGRILVGITEGTADPILAFHSDTASLVPGFNEVRLTIPRLPLPRGRYFVWANIDEHPTGNVFFWQPIGKFDVTGPDLPKLPAAVVRRSPIHLVGSFEMEAVDAAGREAEAG